MRLIRNDLSTIWCELTSSIRTRPVDDIDKEVAAATQPQPKGGNGQKVAPNAVGSVNESAESVQEEKELLLCFRPIREGEVVGEELRFCPKETSEDAEDGGEDLAPTLPEEDHKVSSSGNSSSSKNEGGKKKKHQPPAALKSESTSTSAPSSSTDTQAVTSPPPSPPAKKNRPPKKRKFESEEEEPHQKVRKLPLSKKSSEETQVEDPDEESAVVESMMKLAKKTPM